MTNTDHRAKLATKIKALLAMNMGNGCTEAEALSAAGKASELMAEHDLSYTDIEGEIAVEVFGANKRKFFTGNGRKRGDHPVSRVVMSIGTLWDCRCWVSGDDLIFFGEKSDTEHAHSMADLLRQSIDTEAARFLRSSDRPAYVHGRTLKASFSLGMTSRLAERIREIKAARNATDQSNRAKQGTGSSLVVVVKTRVVAEKFATYSRQQGLKLGKVKGRTSIGSDGAFAAGKAAGGRVDLGGHKVSGGARMIGHG